MALLSRLRLLSRLSLSLREMNRVVSVKYSITPLLYLSRIQKSRAFLVFFATRCKGPIALLRYFIFGENIPEPWHPMLYVAIGDALRYSCRQFKRNAMYVSPKGHYVTNRCCFSNRYVNFFFHY